MAFNRLWTPHEKQLVSYNYPRYGQYKTAQELENKGFIRTPNAVKGKANAMGLKAGIPLGYWTVFEMTKGGWTYDTVKKVAAKEGVLTRFTQSRRNAPLVVPEAWAMEYLERQEELNRREDMGWYTMGEVSTMLGLDITFIQNQFRDDRPGLSHKNLRNAIRSIRRVRGKMNHWLHNPSDVKRVQRQLQASRVVRHAA